LTTTTTTDKPALDSHNSLNDFTVDGSNIKPGTLVEHHKMGLKLVPLSSDNKPIVKWSPIYEDPNFWTDEKLIAESSKFQNVATVFGKTHVKDSEGKDLYLNGLDCDSEPVYSILTTPIEQIQDSAIRSRIESLFSKTEVSAKSLLEFLKQVTCVVKTRKSYGFHIYWLSSRQNNHIRTQDCKQGYNFEIKTDKGGGHATLPPSTHRSDKAFRYSHIGRTDKIEPIDELYELFLELFKDCLYVSINGNTYGKSEEIGSSGRKDKQERVSATLDDMSDEAIETSIAYLTPYYIKSHRNDFTLPFSGAAWYSKISEESAAKILEGVCNATNDEETDSRLQTLHATYQKALNGEEAITGGPSLADLVSKIKQTDLKKAHKIVDALKSIWYNDIKLQKEQHDTRITRELSISQAIREKQGCISVKGQLIGQSSVYNMISAAVVDCDSCAYHRRVDCSEKPVFQSPVRNLHKCPDCGESLAVKASCEYVSTVDIELQDPDKFNEIERLSVRLFEKNTENIIVGEIVTITGNLHVVRKNDNSNSKAVTVLYAQCIEYVHRKEKSKLTEQDIEGIKAWRTSIEREGGKSVISELVIMFAPIVIGNDHVKEGLLMVGANTGLPNIEMRTPKRMRLNALLIGDPSLAKSTILREMVKVIPGARYESAQSSTGLSLTAQVSREDGGTYTLRLGPIPLAKGSLCAINEIGQMPVSDHKHFLDFMEEGLTTINKFAFNATIAGNTSIVASANPINNTWKDKEKIDNSEFPTLTQLIHRFDLIFVFREVTEPATLRAYAIEREQVAKNCELGAYDGYEEFVKKYLMYARSLIPSLSEDAKAMLREYWVRMGEAGVTGLPRKLDTLERIALARAKLKLKDVAGEEEAIETMQYYNVILQHYQQTVTISKKPSDTAYLEVVEVVKEQNGNHISYAEGV
jgi:DNA replicative helicase MCM subunit Mcm2 (Cdc46/Mcm family)